EFDRNKVDRLCSLPDSKKVHDIHEELGKREASHKIAELLSLQYGSISVTVVAHKKRLIIDWSNRLERLRARKQKQQKKKVQSQQVLPLTTKRKIPAKQDLNKNEGVSSLVKGKIDVLSVKYRKVSKHWSNVRKTVQVEQEEQERLTKNREARRAEFLQENTNE
ncbi:13456_t:CDS:2, partial [Cetraspora pellucida]